MLLLVPRAMFRSGALDERKLSSPRSSCGGESPLGMIAAGSGSGRDEVCS